MSLSVILLAGHVRCRQQRKMVSKLLVVLRFVSVIRGEYSELHWIGLREATITEVPGRNERAPSKLAAERPTLFMYISLIGKESRIRCGLGVCSFEN